MGAHGDTCVPAVAPTCPASGPAPDGHGQQGRTVTAETVMVLPLLVAVALGLAWLVSLGATQVRVVDAAREVARSVGT